MVQSLLDPNDPGLSNPVQAIHRHIRMLRQDSALGLQWVLSWERCHFCCLIAELRKTSVDESAIDSQSKFIMFVMLNQCLSYLLAVEELLFFYLASTGWSVVHGCEFPPWTAGSQWWRGPCRSFVSPQRWDLLSISENLLRWFSSKRNLCVVQ